MSWFPQQDSTFPISVKGTLYPWRSSQTCSLLPLHVPPPRKLQSTLKCTPYSPASVHLPALPSSKENHLGKEVTVLYMVFLSFLLLPAREFFNVARMTLIIISTTTLKPQRLIKWSPGFFPWPVLSGICRCPTSSRRLPQLAHGLGYTAPLLKVLWDD